MMYLNNYHLYANPSTLPQIMAEDAGDAALRNPVFVLETGYNYSRLQQKKDAFLKKWNAFWDTHTAEMRPRISSMEM